MAALVEIIISVLIVYAAETSSVEDSDMVRKYYATLLSKGIIDLKGYSTDNLDPPTGAVQSSILATIKASGHMMDGSNTPSAVANSFSKITSYGIQHIVVYITPESWKWPFPACIVKYEVPANKIENFKLEEGPECDSFWILKKFIDQWTEDYNINNPNMNYSKMSTELASSKINTERPKRIFSIKKPPKVENTINELQFKSHQQDSTTDNVLKDSAGETDFPLTNGDKNAPESSSLSPTSVKTLPIQISSVYSTDAAPRLTTELPTLQLG